MMITVVADLFLLPPKRMQPVSKYFSEKTHE